MAKTQLNTALTTLRGRVGDLVFKQYAYGTVVTRVPRMGRVAFTAKQRAHQQRVKDAGRFYRQVVADPELKRKYERIARRRKIPLSAVTLEVFLRETRPQRAAQTT